MDISAKEVLLGMVKHRPVFVLKAIIYIISMALLVIYMTIGRIGLPVWIRYACGASIIYIMIWAFYGKFKHPAEYQNDS